MCHFIKAEPLSPLRPSPAPVPSPEDFAQTPPASSACHPHDNQPVAQWLQPLGLPLAAAALGCSWSSGCAEANGRCRCHSAWMTGVGRRWASGCRRSEHNPHAAVHQRSTDQGADAEESHRSHREFSLAGKRIEAEYQKHIQ